MCTTLDVVTELFNEGYDTIRSGVSLTLAANVERLILVGSPNTNGVGNALDNTLQGNSGANVLDGAAGADRLFGGGGNDTFFAENLLD